MSKDTNEQILKEIVAILLDSLQEQRDIRKEVMNISKRVDRFDEFVLELSPSEAQEEINDLQ
tara:strand:+ start:652 stop:837 length:186 start_codon:yes stop_codon:yes gene_type:complete